MPPAALLLLAPLVTGQCAAERPGPGCPPPHVRHPMVGSIGGQPVAFVGWHDRTGARKYDPAENPELAKKVRESEGLTHGVVLPEHAPEPAHGTTVRTNDPAFGRAHAAWAERRRRPEQAPCPGPGPCPRPRPEPGPDPDPDPDAPDAPDLTGYIPHIVGVALLAAAAFIVLGAGVALVTSRKGS